MKFLNYEEIKALDEEAIALLGVERLMESAGKAIAEAYAENIGEREVCVVAGPGNNGADAVCAARYLKNWGYAVSIFLAFPEKVKGELAKQLSLSKFSISDEVGNSIIDGLFGYGFRGQLSEELEETVERMNEASSVLSIDLLSGIGANGERAKAYVKDTLTVALAWPKEGNRECSRLLVADIGIPAEIYEKRGLDVRELFNKRGLVEI